MSIGDFCELWYVNGVVSGCHGIRKFKDEHMFRDSWTAEDQRAVEHLAKKFSVDLDDQRVTGENATFASIEAAARQLGRAVTRHVTQDLALRQTQLLAEPQPCATCGKLCAVGIDDRQLTTGDGPIELHEAVCHCPACRRDFFPSTRSLGTASARV